MTRHTFLESFDQSKPTDVQNAAPANAVDTEAIRAKAYEAGYASGWEDAIASDNTTKQRVDAEFERNIQNISFSYNEALDRVRGELKNFVDALIQQFLPRILPDLLKEHVRSELMQMGETAIDLPVKLVSAPDCHATIAQLLEADFPIEIQLVEEPSLASGQVFIRMANQEVSVNLLPLVETLQAQFAALQDDGAITEKESQHGGI